MADLPPPSSPGPGPRRYVLALIIGAVAGITAACMARLVTSDEALLGGVAGSIGALAAQGMQARLSRRREGMRVPSPTSRRNDHGPARGS